MPDVTAVPSKAAWATPAASIVLQLGRPAVAVWGTPVTVRTLVSGTITAIPAPGKAAWATPQARVTIRLYPAIMQIKTPAGGLSTRTAPSPSLAAWRTLQGSLTTVAGQGRVLPSLTETLARIAAGLPVADQTILPSEYRGRLP